MEFVTKADYAYQRLRDDILNRKIPAASKLVVNDIAKEYNISAMPVRNAITRLEQAGLVHSVPHIGVWVNDVNMRDYFSLMLLRVEAEALATIMTTSKPSAKLIKNLEKSMKQMIDSKDNKDYGAYAKINRNFHTLVYKDCNDAVIVEYIDTLMQRTHISMHTFSVLPSSIDESCEEHAQWLEAIKTHDIDRSAAIVRHQRCRANLTVLYHLKKSFKDKSDGDIFTQVFQSGLDEAIVDKYIQIFQLMQTKNNFKL